MPKPTVLVKRRLETFKSEKEKVASSHFQEIFN